MNNYMYYHPVIVTDGTIYVVSEDTKLYAIDGESNGDTS